MHATTLASRSQPLDDAVTTLEAAGYELSPPHTVTSSTFDTVDRRLEAAGLNFEFVDAPRPHHRLTSPGSLPALVETPRPVRFATDLPPGPLRARVAAVTDVRALLATAVVHSAVTVATRRDRRGRIVATAVIYDRPTASRPDDGRAAGTVLAPWLVEVSDVANQPDPADDTVAALRAVGCSDSDHLVALARAFVATGAPAPLPSLSDGVDATRSAAVAYRQVLANLDRAIDANWDATLAQVDTEFLHDLRVAIRRTRSVLTEGKGIIDDATRDRFRSEFKWLADATSRPRDLDVYAIEWSGYVAPLGGETATHLEPVLAHLQRHRRRAHTQLGRTMRSSRAATLRHDWTAWLTADVDAPAEPRVGDVVAHRIQRAQRQVVDAGRAITPATPGEALHELRKDAKRLRYLIECFAGVLASKRRKTFVGLLKDLQDNLGRHQDAEVHADELQRVARELHSADIGPDTLVALGQLREQLDRTRIETRTEFAGRFAAYDSKATRRAFAALIDGIER